MKNLNIYLDQKDFSIIARALSGENRFEVYLDCSCPDGNLDLVFHFDTQEVVAPVGDVNDEDCLVLEIIGNLKEDFGGRPIVGEDVVRILKKGKK